MSHITTGTPRIKNTPVDVLALAAAVKEIGLVFCANQQTHKWFGRFVGDSPGITGVQQKDYGKCLHAIRLPRTEAETAAYVKNAEEQPYEIGLVPDPEKPDQLMLVMDTWRWGNGVAALQEKTGSHPAFSKLMAAYAANKVKLQIQNQKGHYLKRIEKLSDGSQVIVIGQRPTQKL